MTKQLINIGILACALTIRGLAADASLVQLRVNDLGAPIGLDGTDVASLRFGWVIASQQRGVSQSAYQIAVASTREKLADDSGNLWDSGKVVSSRQNGIAYAGTPIAGKTDYWWKVRIWDGNGRAGNWSQPEAFETGIIAGDQDWRGQLVGGLDATTNSFNLIRREFNLPPGKTISRARVYVAATVFSRSYWDFHVNGRRVDDTVTMRNGYFTFDVTKLLQAGAANAVGVIFGDWGGKPKQWLCDVIDRGYMDSKRLDIFCPPRRIDS